MKAERNGRFSTRRQHVRRRTVSRSDLALPTPFVLPMTLVPAQSERIPNPPTASNIPARRGPAARALGATMGVGDRSACEKWSLVNTTKT